MAGLTEEMKQLPETENWCRDAKRGASCWVGKMCCKAPGGKYRKSISKSRRTKSRKVERFRFEFRKVEKSKSKKSKSEKASLWISKSRKVYFLTFHFLTFWIFAGCLSSWTCTAKSTKIEPLRSRGKKNSRKPEKSKRWKGRREVKKSKSILFGFHLLTFWIFAGCLSNWKCAAKSTKLEPLRVEREEEKPKTRQVEKVRGKKKSRKVEKYTFWLFTFWLFEFLRMPFQRNMRSSFFQLRYPESWCFTMIFVAVLHGCAGCTFSSIILLPPFWCQAFVEHPRPQGWFPPWCAPTEQSQACQHDMSENWSSMRCFEMDVANVREWNQRLIKNAGLVLHVFSYSGWSEPSCVHQIEVCIMHEPFLCCRGATLENSEYLAAKADPLISVISAQSSTCM